MHFLRPLAVLASALPLSACLEFKQDVARVVSSVTPTAEVEPSWAPLPEKIEWHPASRVRPDAEGKGWVLDARIRLVDGLGDYTKTSGAWRFEAQAGGKWVQRWEEKVRSFKDHKAHFDPATRAYRFTLPFERPPPQGQPMRVWAVFTPEGGDRMAAEMDI